MGEPFLKKVLGNNSRPCHLSLPIVCITQKRSCQPIKAMPHFESAASSEKLTKPQTASQRTACKAWRQFLDPQKPTPGHGLKSLLSVAVEDFKSEQRILPRECSQFFWQQGTILWLQLSSQTRFSWTLSHSGNNYKEHCPIARCCCCFLASAFSFLSGRVAC